MYLGAHDIFIEGVVNQLMKYDNNIDPIMHYRQLIGPYLNDVLISTFIDIMEMSGYGFMRYKEILNYASVVLVSAYVEHYVLTDLSWYKPNLKTFNDADSYYLLYKSKELYITFHPSLLKVFEEVKNVLIYQPQSKSCYWLLIKVFIK